MDRRYTLGDLHLLTHSSNGFNHFLLLHSALSPACRGVGKRLHACSLQLPNDGQSPIASQWKEELLI
ncbi:hypothetical protein DPEC_G00272590 [Dallia pectoralis]|uniref:Uncharacterized protein n=1 Tax=Dallia pectoralis TaxID=75939 RepID=A0ACC2FQ70_DALPE|nr:hypothetical protein DPEC_G00272590 [Dallia pectoralis]